MIDLYGNRANETYTYRKVPWADLSQEGKNLGDVTGGSVELSAFSDLKATCSFTFEGQEEPDPNELIRIYYSFTDDHGQSESFPIGTFFVGFSELTKVHDTRYGMKVSGTCDGWSTLKVLQDVTMGYPYTVQAGTNPVAKASALIGERGLPVKVRSESSYMLANDHTFDSGDSLLTVVNWLCSAANFQAPYPNRMGEIQLEAYVPPEGRSVVAEFANDDNSIMYPQVVYSSDWQSTPNVCKMSYVTDNLAMHAEARNLTGSKASLDSRGGREYSISENVSELDGETAQAMLENLKQRAVNKLFDNSTEIERVQFSHPYVPIEANDAVQVKYGGASWSGTVQNMRINLSPSTKCDTTLRRLVPFANYEGIQATGSIDWEVEE